MTICGMIPPWRFWPASWWRSGRTARRWPANRLNRLELNRPTATRYHKIAHDPAAIAALFVDLFLDVHQKPPKQIILDLDVNRAAAASAR
jgi:hypothetical protein